MFKKTIGFFLLIFLGAGLSSCVKEDISDCPTFHTVTFDPQNGDQPTEIPVEDQQPVARPAPDPVLAGHIFIGWFSDAAGTQPWDFDGEVVTADITLYGKWIPDSYTVTFIPGNGEPPATQTVDYNVLIDRPEDPTRDDYDFLGWFPAEDGTLPWDFDNDRVTSDTTLYGRWSLIPLYTVTFDSQGGSEIPEQIVPRGGLASDPGVPDAPTTSLLFHSWNTQSDGSGDTWDFDSTTVTEDVTLYAQWKRSFVVVLVANGGTPSPPFQTIVEGGLVAEPPPMSRSNYEFGGWYLEWNFSGEAWDFSTDTVTGNTILYAKWVPITFTVTFATNGGTPFPASQTIANGGTVSRPENPMREGYVFIAWYPNPELIGDPWVFSNTVTGDMTLYARWLNPSR